MRSVTETSRGAACPDAKVDLLEPRLAASLIGPYQEQEQRERLVVQERGSLMEN